MSSVKKTEKFYIIGDVHGCYYTLMALIDKLPNKDAKLIFVGDLVDRGDNSAEVVQYVKEQNHYCILGNHELMMIKALKSINTSKEKKYFYEWENSGGSETLQSYKEGLYDIKEHQQWLEKLPYYLEFDIKDENGYKLVVTHGAGLPFYDKRYISKEEIITNRSMEENDYKIINVFGHNPFKEVKFYKNYIGIDTGCVYGKKGKEGYLTALEWPSKKVYQQIYLNKSKKKA